MRTNNLPTFLIIGAAKSGTTALYQCLRQHPEIYMTPIKETNFFAFEGEELKFTGVKQNESSLSYQKEIITNWKNYEQQFAEVRGEKAIGESCPSYLYIHKAAQRIYSYNPNIKLIIILRDPVERAYSNFLHHVRDRNEWTRNFISAVKAEPKRIEENWWWGFHYVQVSLYFKQVKRFLDLFGKNQTKVYLYQDYLSHPKYILNDILNFLEVDNQHNFDLNAKYNAAGIPKNRILSEVINEPNFIKTAYQKIMPFSNIRHKITKQFSSLNFSKKPSLSSEVRNILLPLFYEDILNLQDLIERDLSSWLV